MAPGDVILGLKLAVAAVTVLLVASLACLAAGRPRWHGRINHVFFALTATTVIGFEALIRLVNPQLTADFTPDQRDALRVHLAFAVPAALLLPVMLYTGVRRHKRSHRTIAVGFLILWAGTFVTGVVFLPHTFEAAP